MAVWPALGAVLVSQLAHFEPRNEGIVIPVHSVCAAFDWVERLPFPATLPDLPEGSEESTGPSPCLQPTTTSCSPIAAGTARWC